MPSRELIHVDNSLDELRDLATMQLAERQQESLKQMHIRNILMAEERKNRLRDFQEAATDLQNSGNTIYYQRIPNYEVTESIVIDPNSLTKGF